jgi:glutamyl/glutaminyl-tRNA synthetase
VVVDDHEMGITHVIRGEEWVPSTPKHLWLYKAFGWDAPVHAHLPLMLNADKSKLSKRQGDVAAEDYIKKGYLKEAILNFIAFVGWSPGTEEEFFTLPELIKAFSLERVQKAGAVFNVEKLDWMNGHYLRELHAADLAVMLLPLLNESDWFKQTAYVGISEDEIQTGETSRANDLVKYVACVQTRMKTLQDAPDQLRPFLLDDLEYSDLFFHEKMKVDRAMALMAIENALEALETHEDYSDETVLKEVIVGVIKSMGVKNGQMMWPLRIALTNEQYSAGAFELMAVMGKDMSLDRLKKSISYLKGNA